MKKNLLTVIILALVLVNLILTAVLAFSVIPQTKKSNELIDQVCAAINIELEGGQNKDSSAVPIEEIAVYNITDNFTVNLADNGIDATVDVSELMGSELHLHVNSAGKDVVIVVPTTDIDIDSVHGGHNAVKYSFRPDLMHFFNKETEKNLF